MSSISQFISNFNAQKGFKASIRKKLLGSMIQCFEMTDKEIDSVNSRLNEAAETIKQNNDSVIANIENILNRLQNCENTWNEISNTFGNMEQSVNFYNELIPCLRRDLENACENLRNNNAMLENLGSDSEFAKVKIASLEKKLKNIGTAPASPAAVSSDSSAAPATAQTQEDTSDYESIDYFDFENHFRGSIESIKKAQSAYLPYFSGKKNVLDIGCGRGEFLSLMKDNGINAQGVDIYEPYTDYCNMKGLKASCGDGTAFLAGLESVDGIFVGQVVEHLQTHEIIRLCNTAYEKLEEGGCIIIETPNPTSLAIYTHAFYIDPSHIKPVHPLTMKYYLEKAGFRNIEVIFTENSRLPYSIPELSGGSEEFNSAMKRVSDALYGSQDYAVVAVK